MGDTVDKVSAVASGVGSARLQAERSSKKMVIARKKRFMVNSLIDFTSLRYAF
jgi:hypothetical protein